MFGDELGHKVLDQAIDKYIDQLKFDEEHITQTSKQIIEDYRSMLEYRFRGINFIKE